MLYRDLTRFKDDSGAGTFFQDMFNLVIAQQKPRILHYISSLDQAMRSIQPDNVMGSATPQPLGSPSIPIPLLEEFVRGAGELPVAHTPTWIDNHGHRYCFALNPTAGQVQSMVTPTWSDSGNLGLQIDRILCSARKLSSDTCPEIEWRPELENLMRSALRLWRSEHGQVALRSWTKRQFTGGSSQQKLFHDSLLYLARIYYAVEVFTEAARKFVCGRSVCYVSAPFLAIQCRRRGRLDPADATSKTLATLVVDKRKISPKVTRDLEQSLPKLYQQNENDRHTHAEIQALYHLEVLFPSQDKTYTVHPYIGCSRRCCFLCKAFVEVTYPEMRVRGTHYSLMHRWELQQHFPSAALRGKFENGAKKLLQTLRDVLKTALLGRVSPKKALAQSSFGLPSEASLEWGRLAKMERAHTKTKYVRLHSDKYHV